MDVLSEILSSVRSVSPLLAALRMRGNWGLDMEDGGHGTPFHYVASGQCWLLVGDEHRLLRRGDLVVLPPWPRHAIASAPDVELRSIRDVVTELGYASWTAERGIDEPINIGSAQIYDVEILSGIFGFDSANAAFLTEALPATMHIEAMQNGVSPWLDAMLVLIGQEHMQTQPGFTALAGRGMEFIFVHSLRSWILQHEHPPGWLRGVLDPQIKRALQAIHGAPGREWRLSELAAHAGQSRAAFAMTFREVMDETPFAYLARWRMSQAAARLTRSNDAISTIAADYGYASAFALSRAFRAQFGCTPATFRKQATQLDSR